MKLKAGIAYNWQTSLSTNKNVQFLEHRRFCVHFERETVTQLTLYLIQMTNDKPVSITTQFNTTYAQDAQAAYFSGCNPSK